MSKFYVGLETTSTLTVGSTGTFAEAPGSLNATPTISFGDGDSGFYERSDDDIRVSLGGSGIWEFSSNCMGSVNEGRAHFNNETATATNPSIIPWRNDADTGIGRGSANVLSLIAGGVEALSLASTTATFAGRVGIGVGAVTPAQPLHIIDTDGANIILNSNTGAENSGIWMTEAAAASPYTNGAYMYYDGTNNAFKINTGTTTLSTRFTIDRDTGDATFAGTLTIPSYIYHTSDPSDDTYFGFSANDTFTVYTAGGEGLNIDSNRKVTLTGVLSLPDGAVGAPSVTNTGDLTTGMYWPGDHQLGFAVDGSRKFYMSTTKAYFQNLSSGVEISAGGIDVTGNSSISAAGTGNSPILSVTDTADTEVAWFTGNRIADTGAYIAIRHLPSTAAESNRTGIKFQAYDDGDVVTTYAQITQYIRDYTGATEDGDLAFSTIQNATLTEVMRVTSKVGIGCTDPTGMLEIQQAQVTTQFDRDSFLRLHPSATTDSGGYTNMIFGTSTTNNYGVAIGGLREGTDGEPSFSMRMLDDSISGTEVLNINSTGDATFAGDVNVTGDVIIDGSNGVNGVDLLRPTDSAVMQAISAPDSSTLKIGGGNQSYVKIYAHTTEVVEFNNSGNATFAGDVTAGESQNAASFIKATNTNTGVSATARVQAVGESSQIDMIATSAGYTGVAGWADSGIISTDSGASGGLILNAVAGSVEIQTAQTTALTITSGQNAFFAANLTVEGSTTTFSPDADSTATITNAGTDAIAFFAGAGDTLYLGGNNTTGMYLDTSANAHFAGDITATGGTIKIDSAGSAEYIVDRANDTSGAVYEYHTNGSIKWFHGMRGLSDSEFYLFNYGTGANALQIAATTSNATFAANISNTSGQIIPNELSMGDDKKILIGNGDDLQIYHDASNSYIANSGGNLYLDVTGSDDMVFRFKSNDTAMTIDGGSTEIITSISLRADSGIVLNGDSQIELDVTPGSGNASGTIIKTGTTVVAYGTCYMLQSGPSWAPTEVEDEEFSKGLLAIGLGAGAANSVGMLTNGIYYDSAHGFSIGAPLYLVGDSGLIDDTAPSGSGDLVRVVGYAIDDNEIYFCPDTTWVILD